MSDSPSTNPAKVLVVEDDPTIAAGLCDNFRFAGYEVMSAVDGHGALETAIDKKPDLIVLDIMLPGLNGYEVCRRLRTAGVVAPVLLLTAKNETEDIVLGFQVGADDYVTKPFRIKEVLARMERMLTRSRQDEAGSLTLGDCLIDLKARTVRRDEETLQLTPKEFDLLLFLHHHRGAALPRERILAAVWGNRLVVTERSVDRCIKSLRQKIESDATAPKWIQTVHRIGYRLADD